MPIAQLPAGLARLTGMAAVIVASAATACAAGTAAAALSLGTRFVYGQRSSINVLAVERGNGSGSFVDSSASAFSSAVVDRVVKCDTGATKQ